jgi:hypothetical protein
MTKPTIPDAALAQHLAVLGKTGSGKTTTAKLAVEQAVAGGARVCVLDPIKSDWWGLTSSADGKHPGLPFHILGGPRGHVPLHDAAGKAVAEVVAAGALPLSIIDMADFRPGGQAKFFVDFAPALLRRMRGVLYLVLEEAHLFAPKERSGIGEENMAIHWAKMLATAGRSKGVRLIVLTQRTQALHNALLGSCDSIIAHRLTAPADQEPVLKWLGANADKATAAEVAASLSSLKTGEGWLCSGEAQLFERRQFPRVKTYDNTRTPTDGDGEQHVQTAPVDAGQLRAIIGDAVKEAEANDPRELKRRVADLERQLRERPAAAPDAAATQRAVAAALHEQDARFAEWQNRASRQIYDLRRRLGKIAELAAVPAEDIQEPAPVMQKPAPIIHKTAPAIHQPAQAPAEGLTAPQQAILDTVLMLGVRGIPATRESVARWLGIHPNGGRYGSNLGFLRQAGYLDGFALTARRAGRRPPAADRRGRGPGGAAGRGQAPGPARRAGRWPAAVARGAGGRAGHPPERRAVRLQPRLAADDGADPGPRADPANPGADDMSDEAFFHAALDADPGDHAARALFADGWPNAAIGGRLGTRGWRSGGSGRNSRSAPAAASTIDRGSGGTLTCEPAVTGPACGGVTTRTTPKSTPCWASRPSPRSSKREPSGATPPAKPPRRRCTGRWPLRPSPRPAGRLGGNPWRLADGQPRARQPQAPAEAPPPARGPAGGSRRPRRGGVRQPRAGCAGRVPVGDGVDGAGDRPAGPAVDRAARRSGRPDWGLGRRELLGRGAGAGGSGPVKIFAQHDLKAAYAHAAEGGQALHLHRIVFARSPKCFRDAVARGEDIAHLFDQDAARLEATARRLGVRVIKVEHPGTARQHIDLCGGPLAKAKREADAMKGKPRRSRHRKRRAGHPAAGPRRRGAACRR